MGRYGAAHAVGGHNDAGIFADILFEPPPYDGACHSTAHKHDAEAVEGGGKINMYQIGGKGTEGSCGDQGHPVHYILRLQDCLCLVMNMRYCGSFHNIF